MINHISKHSPYFLDFQQKHDKSKYSDLFLSWDKFWPEGRPTKHDIDLIYKRSLKHLIKKLNLVTASKKSCGTHLAQIRLT